MSAPASGPAGDAVHRLLRALAERYGAGEFPARAAAADIPRELWREAGVARPDAGSCGRWLRFRKGAVAGFVLGGRPDRDGVARWSLRPVATSAALATPAAREAGPRLPPDPSPPASAPSPPEAPPGPASRPWWSTPPAPSPGAGGAAGRDGGPWWELGGGKAP